MNGAASVPKGGCEYVHTSCNRPGRRLDSLRRPGRFASARRAARIARRRAGARGVRPAKGAGGAFRPRTPARAEAREDGPANRPTEPKRERSGGETSSERFAASAAGRRRWAGGIRREPDIPTAVGSPTPGSDRHRGRSAQSNRTISPRACGRRRACRRRRCATSSSRRTRRR
jgi:hypothetical protein